LRELKRDHGREVTLFCAHDPVEMRQLAANNPTRSQMAA
jgi:hypothetical protein